MTAITEIIKKRFSCRTYSEKSLEDKVMRQLMTMLNSAHKGPFGNEPRFRLIHLASFTAQEGGAPPEDAGGFLVNRDIPRLSESIKPQAAAGGFQQRDKKLGTYGVIKNARLFLVGTIKDGHLAMEDYGYCKENIILHATALGLGTCWLGGTFQSSNFARAVDLQKDELLPSVTPIGYPALEKSFTEKMMRRVAGSDHRKAWSDIFFAGNFSTPLTKEMAGAYTEALGNIRIAPSASNKQPWRVLRDHSKNLFHFFLERSLQYKMIGIVHLQDIDLGIAMCHFDLTLQELGIKGKWLVDPNAPKEKSLEYIISWQAD
jgi:nitroreductase